MAHDPLAQYRKTPASMASSALPPQETEGYEAFAAKDNVSRLRIRSKAVPINSVGYNILLNVIYDVEGTHFILVFTILIVLVRGRNLQKVIFAIENGQADFLQEYDSRKWQKPNDATAPLIESIEIKKAEGGNAAPEVKH
jgi:hypothetical protein